MGVEICAFYGIIDNYAKKKFDITIDINNILPGLQLPGGLARYDSDACNEFGRTAIL